MSALYCKCGKLFKQIPAGVSKRGKPYAAFWSCTGYPACTTSLTAEEYDKYTAAGLDMIPDTVKMNGPKSWIRTNFKGPRTPRQRTNNDARIIPYRRMTDEQERVINGILNAGAMWVIEANCDAGTGKSSTIRQLAVRTRKLDGEFTTGIVLTFGKKATMDMAKDLPAHWVASTVHSAGNDAVCSYYGTNPMNANEKKTRQILWAEYGKPGGDDPESGIKRALYTIVEGIVELAKALALTELTATDDILMERSNYYNVDIGESPNQAFTMVRNVLKISRSHSGIKNHGHDFDDMVWLPVVNNIPVAQYRFVIGDEWQDSSISRIKLAMKMCAGTFAYVGDKDQAIFGFTFADTSSMETCARLVDDLLHRPVQSYPMTINWRCPSSVIELTKLIHPSIQARPSAPRGHIHLISPEDVMDVAKPGDLILCRVNADLIRYAYDFIKAGVAAVVLGRDIADRLEKIIRQHGVDERGNWVSITTLINRLNDWYTEEGDKIVEKNLRNTEKVLQNLDDDYYCIIALCGIKLDVDGNIIMQNGKMTELKTVEDVLNKIRIMFGESTDKTYDPSKVITLSTVHKMKGGQCARVFIIKGNEYHPHSLAKSAWELVQEMCILYVAITRCGDGTDNPNQRLFFIGGIPNALAAGQHLITAYEGVYQNA